MKLKLADALPIYKKRPSHKENYRPVSSLSHISKVFGRLLYKKIKTFMSNKLSTKLSGLRKNYKHSIAYFI